MDPSVPFRTESNKKNEGNVNRLEQFLWMNRVARLLFFAKDSGFDLQSKDL